MDLSSTEKPTVDAFDDLPPPPDPLEEGHEFSSWEMEDILMEAVSRDQQENGNKKKKEETQSNFKE